MEKRVRRVGIVGFGRLGIYTCSCMHTELEYCFTVSIATTMWLTVLSCLLYHVGRYLYEVLVEEYRDDYEVAFVWNRSLGKMHGTVPQHLVLQDLSAAASKHPDLIVEVAHPSIIAEYGKLFLQTADFMVDTFFHSGKNVLELTVQMFPV